MPAQTTKTSNIKFPDGCKVEVQPAQTGSFYDVGAINSATTATLNYDENQVETANAGKTIKQIKNMTIEGGFTLIELDPEGVEKMGAGIFTLENTLGSLVLDANITDQVIQPGWDDGILYALEPIETSTGNLLRTTTAPTLTSVTLDAGGVPEVLTDGNDYTVVADSNSASGWSIQFISANMTTGSPKTLDITIDYGDNTPIANTVIYAGNSTELLTAYAMRFTHTDDNGKIRRLTLYSVDSNSGGFQFNFKGANEDGLEEMPLTFTAKVDTSRVAGKQLMAWEQEEGAL